MNKKNEITVIGHKNPDTDSICSAIAYANLKNHISSANYVAKRCGDISKETSYVLDRFSVAYPPYINDVRTQVSDIEIKQVDGVSGDISIKKAYSIMKKHNAVTLVATKADNRIDGVITIGDIAASDMDVYDSKIVSKANTSYKNIVETIEGRVLCGDIDGYFNEGRVTVAANTPDLMEDYIGPKDLVITGNRFESQFFAVEMGVSCIVVCTNNEVSEIVLRNAKEKGCIIISSPYDSYTVARLINQSMPIKYFMTSKNLLKFNIDDFTNDVKEVMAKNRHRYFPVLNEKDEYIGQISKRSFLDMEKKKIILVDHNEKNQAVDGIQYAEILEIIDHHRLGSLETINPVFFRNQPVGCTASIVYEMYNENGVEITPEIAGILCAAIISDTLMFRSPTCTTVDKLAAENLANIAEINIQEFAEQMFSAGSSLKELSDEEIFYQDYKEFSNSGINFGVGQITSMNVNDLQTIKLRMNDYMDKLVAKSGMDMIIIMLTNIIDESSILLFKGAKAKEFLEIAYGSEFDGDSIFVPGMVSRKKQLIPDLMQAIQQ
ncbi:MAG TPA: putative manganese-dependent inorganic diphosphatase [Lachnospiraceae bacterium]|nr:putative manganese-dependent inorganic diphosphatase [Lachnospiraceae bacterium]